MILVLGIEGEIGAAVKAAELQGPVAPGDGLGDGLGVGLGDGLGPGEAGVSTSRYALKSVWSWIDGSVVRTCSV